MQRKTRSMALMTLTGALVSVVALLGSPMHAQTLTPLYTFTGGADGGYPGADLVQDKHGNLYGTTQAGGVTSSRYSSGAGVVFKIDTGGHESVLYSFTGGADGAYPVAGLVRDKHGNLYGTTEYGGDLNSNDGIGSGVVFEVDTGGHESVLHTFTDGADGGIPHAGLVRDKHGNLYGTAEEGGGSSGGGVVFKLSSAGHYSVVYSFTDGDGIVPVAGLILDKQGNIYGTTQVGGNPSGYGTAFKVDPSGHEIILHTFTGGSDGAFLFAGLVRDKQGNLYGTTYAGGNPGDGVVFKLDPSGNETILHTFTGGADGASPIAGLVKDKHGNLYGTTVDGGASGAGVVFKLTP